jgi:hypothetical protein
MNRKSPRSVSRRRILASTGAGAILAASQFGINFGCADEGTGRKSQRLVRLELRAAGRRS